LTDIKVTIVYAEVMAIFLFNWRREEKKEKGGYFGIELDPMLFKFLMYK